MVAHSARRIAIIALVLSLMANVVGIVTHAGLSYNNCKDIELLKTQLRNTLSDSLARLKSGDLDSTYQRVYQSEWKDIKDFDIERMKRQIKRFEKDTCTRIQVR